MPVLKNGLEISGSRSKDLRYTHPVLTLASLPLSSIPTCPWPRRYQETLRGVLLNIPTEVIEAAGWVPVYVEPYSHKTSMAELENCMYRLNEGKPFKYIIVGARESTTPQLSLCALGRTETVLKQTAGPLPI
jgi:hypothetical protein